MDPGYNLRKIFEAIERDLIRSMQRNLKRHEAWEEEEGFKWEQWQSAKIRNLAKFRRENKKLFDDRAAEIKQAVNQPIDDGYTSGQNVFQKIWGRIKRISSGRTNLLKQPENVAEKQQDIPFDDQTEKKEEDFFHVNDQKIEALQETVNNDLEKAKHAALRKMDDVYRKTIHEAEMHMAAGAKTLDQAIDMATKNFLEQGINCIEYKNGRRANIASYAEMCLRTASHRATLLGEGKMRAKWGIYTVVVSAHANTCPKCERWQGKILIDDVFSGLAADESHKLHRETGYPLLSTAIEYGLLHPNCRHTLSTYFESLTEIPQVPNGKDAIKRYEAEQKQRQLERVIRKWKRIAEGSTDPANVKQAEDEVKKYQGELIEHLDEHSYLRRNYSREKIRGI